MFNGIAFIGLKAAGKDTFLDYIVSQVPRIIVLRTKTPLVEAYEKIVGHPYEKARDDAELMFYSRTKLRPENPNIVVDYLNTAVPEALAKNRSIPVIPDLRFLIEADMCYDSLNMFCIRIETSLETRKKRIIARDGDLQNFNPEDPTEVEIPLMRSHYTIDNEMAFDSRAMSRFRSLVEAKIPGLTPARGVFGT